MLEAEQGQKRGLLPEMWREARRGGGTLSFRVASGSMEPLLRVGDVVRVVAVAPAEIGVGDVAAFCAGDDVVVHRVINRVDDHRGMLFRHRGDAGSSSALVHADRLIGRVSATERDGREVSLLSRRARAAGKVLGWRLRLIDSLDRGRRHRRAFRIMLRPMWRLGRRLLLRQH